MEANEGTRREIRHWLFQANPEKYRIHDSLSRESGEWWNLLQHAAEVQAGDLVAIWISGPEAGIYAIGTVMEGPIFMPDSVRGQGYWEILSDGLKPRPRVRVQYDRVLFHRPLLKVFIEADPDLWNLRIVRAPRGTNFSVRPDEWRALQHWLNN